MGDLIIRKDAHAQVKRAGNAENRVVDGDRGMTP
jgi:hypothetical protein